MATGIGIFAAVFNEKNEILLRTREEKGSLYGKDLSGNWELPGGGVELEDFTEGNYTLAIHNCIKKELFEEAGVELIRLPTPIKMLPAWLAKNNLIDLAFVIRIPWGNIKETSEFQKKRCRFFKKENITNLNIVSPRMKFLIEEAFSS